MLTAVVLISISVFNLTDFLYVIYFVTSSPPAMFGRTALACMDHNENCNRPQKMLANGEQAYRVKVSS